MILWNRTTNILLKHCPSDVTTLKEALFYLYVTKDLGLEAISKLTEREVLSKYTIRRKLMELKIPLKKRGGVNNYKNVPLTEEDLKFMSKRELSRKYDVSSTTICNKERKLLKEVNHEKSSSY